MSVQTLSKEINALEVFLGDEDCNTDRILTVIDSLNRSIETLQNQEWDNETIRTFILGENDPLGQDDGISESFIENVREIQHEIINYFS